MNEKRIIVLGGAGYIGSHTCRALSHAGYDLLIIDNLSRGHCELCGSFRLEVIDILNTEALTSVFKEYKPAAVMHFAALIEVVESIKNPESFYRNNVDGTASVLRAMQAAGVDKIVFSSTAAVYGQPKHDGNIIENQPLAPINPYGESKLKAEKLIQMHTGISSVCLRYFNAAGSDENSAIGEAHFPESHLIPLVIHTALGMREKIVVYGGDYPTPDGSCVRDYIHVVDLVDAHMKALAYLLEGGQNLVCNLGTGNGASVREIIKSVQQITCVDFVVEEADRRLGDPAILIADNRLASSALKWAPCRGVKEIIQSAYQWHKSDLYQQLYKRYKDVTVRTYETE